ncbi:MAG: DUF4271 domain-containing protein [Sphingobacterium composti]
MKQIIKNKQHIMLFLFLLCSYITSAKQEDSLSVHNEVEIEDVQIDTLTQSQKSALPFNYVILDTNATAISNPIRDSLLSIIEIEYTDLGAWFAKMDKLKKARNLSPQIEKLNRPIWLVSVLILILLSIGLVRIFFYPTFLNIIYGCFNERVLAQISKEDNVLTSWPYIFLYIIFSFSLGLFVLIYFSAKQDLLFLTINNFTRLSLIIGVMFVAKLLLVRIISVIFETEKLARNYITMLYIVYFNSLLFLIPLLILAVFLPFSYIDILVVILVVGTIFLFTYRMIRTAFNLLGNLKFSIFYLILYLCALEIAPILILVKSLNN